MGKVVTIFYAILGIPLMLLCLSNIGDVMATSFRFLYWRVCCYVCTRKPKRRRHRSVRGAARQSSVRHNRTRSASCRRPARISQRSGDSGFVAIESLPSYSYSDTECRYNDETPQFNRGRHLRASQMSRFSDNGASGGASRSNPLSATLGRGQGRGAGRAAGRQAPQDRNQRSYSQAPTKLAVPSSSRAASLDRRQKRSSSETRTNTDLDARTAAHTSVLFNKYAVDPGYSGPKGRTGRNIYDPDDIESGDEIDADLMRIKSLPRHHRDNFFMEGETRKSDRDIRGERSPRFDRSSRIEQGAVSRNSKDDLDLPRSRDEFPRCAGDLKGNRDPRQGRDYKFRHSLEVEDARNRYRDSILQQLDGRGTVSDRERGRHARERSGYDRDSDDDVSPYCDDEPDMYVSDTELAAQKAARQRRRERAHAPSARIMSPMGISVHRQARYVEDYDTDAYDDGFYQPRNQIKPVPIWLCVFLVVSYIVAGAFLFSEWEDWPLLDSAYFCFITLTTIGFGDFVPAQGVKANSEVSIALCSLYLLFGISLLAMSFNLVQEEVIANVKSVAKRLGIIKPELGDESDEE